MRHSYVGDAGDFGKYGLLRAFCERDHDQLGVVWYLTDSDEHNNDGRHDGYLNPTSRQHLELYRNCDQQLYDRLAEIREQTQLDLGMVEDGSVLPRNTVFYREPVPVLTENMDREEAWVGRHAWHEAALESTTGSRMVFTDPDNGIIFSDRGQAEQRKPSHKHVYWHEIKAFLDRQQSVVAYHHFGRHMRHTDQIQHCLRVIRSAGFNAWAVHYRRGTARAFVVIPADQHHDTLWQRSQSYAGTWQAHASLVA